MPARSRAWSPAAQRRAQARRAAHLRCSRPDYDGAAATAAATRGRQVRLELQVLEQAGFDLAASGLALATVRAAGWPPSLLSLYALPPADLAAKARHLRLAQLAGGRR